MMVERADLGRVNGLYEQYLSIQGALGIISSDGARITAFELTGPPSEPDPPEPPSEPEEGEEPEEPEEGEEPEAAAEEPVGGTGDVTTVSAEGITYPPQMIQAIKTQLEARLEEVNRQLAELGVGPSSRPPSPGGPISPAATR